MKEVVSFQATDDWNEYNNNKYNKALKGKCGKKVLGCSRLHLNIKQMEYLGPENDTRTIQIECEDLNKFQSFKYLR